MDKHKKAIICGLSILAVIVVIGVLLYIFTDFLKTKEQLFWKYFVVQKDEVTSVFVNKELNQFNKEEKESSYSKEGNITVSTEFNVIKPIDIKISEKGNNNEKVKNTYIDVKYDNESYANATIIKDNDYYLIKSNLTDDEYIGIENNNLKELAKELGIKNTEYIPNKLRGIDFSEIFSLTENECLYFQYKYLPIYKKHIKNSDYKKNKNVKLDKNNEDVTAYELQLTEKQVKDFLLDILTTASEDETTLKIINKKISLIIQDDKYSNTEFIKEKLDELIKYLSDKDAKDEKFLSIIIYKKWNNVIKTEIVLNNNRTFSIEKNDEDNKIVIKQYGIKDKKIELDSTEGILKTVFNSLGEITYKKKAIDDKTINVEIGMVFYAGLERITVNYNYVEKIENNIDGLIYKNDVEFTDFKKYSQKIIQNVVTKIKQNMVPENIKEGIFDTGINY